MKRVSIVAATSALLFCSTIAASAQSFQNLPLRNNGQLPEGYISVQAGLSFNVPLKDVNDYGQEQTEAAKTFYRIAGSYCTTLLATVADSCEIKSLSSNADVQNFEGRSPNLTVRGQITMAIKLKPATKQPN
ncbi:hypothetical protein [Rhizobium tubonense]|uniref:Uncharacterized protein n=1 Tax=Rhizobium tubonense TaxID=484088 RepID=A0A2W4D032_9HYPH|nr:hypothetical protein [Rhizobium tubonense]PZM16891.1 hypothetical protein CPY51_01170 [Rhizobium tubonense]